MYLGLLGPEARGSNLVPIRDPRRSGARSAEVESRDVAPRRPLFATARVGGPMNNRKIGLVPGVGKEEKRLARPQGAGRTGHAPRNASVTPPGHPARHRRRGSRMTAEVGSRTLEVATHVRRDAAPTALEVVSGPTKTLGSRVDVGWAGRGLACVALGRRFDCTAQLVEDSRDPKHAPHVARAGRDGKAPAASPGTFAAVDELADPGRVEVVELVEHHDDRGAGALLGQQRLAKLALRGHVQFAAEDQQRGAVHFGAPLDAEGPSASVRTRLPRGVPWPMLLPSVPGCALRNGRGFTHLLEKSRRAGIGRVSG